MYLYDSWLIIYIRVRILYWTTNDLITLKNNDLWWIKNKMHNFCNTNEK